MIKGAWTEEAAYYGDIPCYRLYGKKYLGSVFVYDDGSIKASAEGYGTSNHTSLYHAKTALEEFFGVITSGENALILVNEAEDEFTEAERNLKKRGKAVDRAEAKFNNVIRKQTKALDVNSEKYQQLKNAKEFLALFNYPTTCKQAFNHGEAQVSFTYDALEELGIVP